MTPRPTTGLAPLLAFAALLAAAPLAPALSQTAERAARARPQTIQPAPETPSRVDRMPAAERDAYSGFQRQAPPRESGGWWGVDRGTM